MRFSCATDKGEQSVLVAIPQGARPVLVSAIPQGARALAAEDLSRAAATSTVGPLVEINPTKSVRGWLVAPVIVRGVSDNLTYESVDIEIRFEQDPAFQFNGATPAALGAFEEIFAATVVNFAQAKSWNSGSRLSRSFAAPLPSSALSYTSDWLKLTVRDQGLVRLNGSDIGAPLNSSSVRVFYGGGEPLPSYNTLPRPALEEIPLLVFDGGDGVFNANDYLLFYGETASRWRFPADSAPVFVRNVYTNDNYYWLTTDGAFPDPALRMTALDGSVTGGAVALNSGRALARLESEELLSRNSRDDIDDFYNWYWTGATQHQITVTAPAPLTDPLQDDTTRFSVHAIAGAVNLTVNGAPAVEVFDPPQESWSFFGAPLQSGSNSLDFGLSRFFSRGPFFDFVEVSYLTQLALRSGEAELYFP
ncbi:MAG TPA: hypothetical protein VLB27_09330, partial [candidate division Zixibacteria bacterium]|nr:hypothetical protein [candidate division Zixibacteria bacterium]